MHFGPPFLPAGFIRRRPAVLLLCLPILLMALAWWATSVFYSQAMENARTEARSANQAKLDRMVQLISSSYLTLSGIPQVLAFDTTLQKASLLPPLEASPLASPLLEDFAKRLGSDVIWLLGADGHCVAASNYRQPESFVGVNYTDRLYFQDPKQGKLGRQFAIGRKTGMPGLFFSAPILVGGKFTGVVALKTNLPQLANQVLQPGTFITDIHGVVILSHQPSLLLHSMPDGTVATMSPQDRILQYSTDELPPVPLVHVGNGQSDDVMRFDVDPQSVLLSHLDVPDEGLKLYALTPIARGKDIEGERMHWFFAACILSIVITILAGWLHGIRALYYRQITNHQMELERQVAERTQTILTEVERRTKSESAMRDAQTQAMQAAKLASVGQLAAGIAHEINTPTQYIADNLHFIGDSLTTVLNAIQVAQNLLATKAPDAATDFATQVDTEDLTFVSGELLNAVTDSLQGVNQVASIVQSMKEFSHPGTHAKATTDINRALESTLTVSRNVWKHAAEIRLDLDADLPTILCLAGEINQVFLNIIVNAAQAIEESRKPFPGTIGIKTSYDDSDVIIRISDTGNGVPAAISHKIYDPFFTTKPVGQGTGQGLAICYDVVVNKHGGSLELESQDGEGATFTIRLPRKRDDEETDTGGSGQDVNSQS